MISFYEQIGKNLYENKEEEFEKLANDYLKRSLYYQKIKDLYEVFDASKIQVIFFEDFTGEKFDKVINQLFDFIQVDRSSKNFLHENKTRRIKSRIIDKTLKIGRGTKARKVFVKLILHFSVPPMCLQVNRKLLGKMLTYFNLQYQDAEHGKQAVEIMERSQNFTGDESAPQFGLVLSKFFDGVI